MERIEAHLLNLPKTFHYAGWPEKIEYMFRQQLETWEMARNHYNQFQSIEKRTIHFDGYQIDLQHNAARARSTCADLSKEVIETRKCFLCAHHLPVDQKGYSILDKYLLLVNPFPIFERHMTISDFNHTPQRIHNRIIDMLSLAKELEGYTVFYNGPHCGASAPDHFHFQAVKAGEMPIDRENGKGKTENGKQLFKAEDIKITQIENYLRTTIVLESGYREPIDYFFNKTYQQLPFDEESGEPMMNLLANFENGKYRLTIFPRKMQRPSCYFREGDTRILVSPASVELGGVVVTPREEDFKKISKHDLTEILREVSLNGDELKNLTFDSSSL